jgi:hypothetical protein
MKVKKERKNFFTVISSLFSLLYCIIQNLNRKLENHHQAKKSVVSRFLNGDKANIQKI